MRKSRQHYLSLIANMTSLRERSCAAIRAALQSPTDRAHAGSTAPAAGTNCRQIGKEVEPCGEDDAVATGFMTSPTEALLGEITRGGVSASVSSFIVQ